jgi:Tol biopolymer transport system component
LYIANLAGDFKPRRLYSNPDIRMVSPFDWSPDDRFLAVSIQREDQTRQIGLISVPDGSLRVLKSIDWQGVNRIYFSPDGKYVGYDLAQNDNSFERDVFVMSVDGSREIRAVEHPSNDLMMGWSPDGKWLLFVSDRSGSMDLWGQALSDGKPLGAPERLRANIPVAQGLNPMGITRSGALFCGLSGGQNRYKIQVGEFDFATGKLSHLTNIAQDYLESNVLPVWSPDGRQLVYKSLRGPEQRSSALSTMPLWSTREVAVIRSMDTGETRELCPKLSYFGPMMWSPDGRSFLTLGGDLRGRAGIYQIDVQTGDATTLLLDRPRERSWYPIWAPDGKSFYFRRDYSATHDSGYIQVEMATGKETELVRRKVLSQVDLSPDGKYFATRSVDEATNSRTLLLISVAGGEIRELKRFPSGLPPQDLAADHKGVWLGQGAWAPDSRSVLASTVREAIGGVNRENVDELWRFPIDGGAPQKLDFDRSLETWTPGAVTTHPDGRRVAIQIVETAPRRDTEIWVLENFLPSVTAKK